jgi:hypothetical protein
MVFGPVTQEAEMGGWRFEASPSKKVSKALFEEKTKTRLETRVAYTCNPRYSGGRSWEDCGFSTACERSY